MPLPVPQITQRAWHCRQVRSSTPQSVNHRAAFPPHNSEAGQCSAQCAAHETPPEQSHRAAHSTPRRSGRRTSASNLPGPVLARAAPRAVRLPHPSAYRATTVREFSPRSVASASTPRLPETADAINDDDKQRKLPRAVLKQVSQREPRQVISHPSLSPQAQPPTRQPHSHLQPAAGVPAGQSSRRPEQIPFTHP
jgi:hypothetical protein